MVTTPGGDLLFETGEDPDSLDWTPDSLCIAASEYFGTTVHLGTVRQRDAMLSEYLDWAEAGRPRHPNGRPAWPPEPEDPAKVAERNRSLLGRAIHAATGVFVKVPDRYARPPETVEAPPSFDDEDGEWVDMPGIPSTPPVGNPQGLESPEVAPDSALVSEEALSREHDRQAAKWSRGKGIPLHKKERPSQTYAGRRRRFLRLVAERENITIRQAAQLHRPRGPQPKGTTNEENL